MHRLHHVHSPIALLLLSACAYDPESNVDEDLLAHIDDLETQLAEVQTKHDILASQVDELQSLAERYVTHEDLDELSEDVVHLLTTDVTYTVSTAEELTAALSDLDRFRIGAGATASIEVAPGNYQFTEAITVEHPDGARIRIHGATSDPNDVVLIFAGSDGVLVHNGQVLGYLGELTLQGDGSYSSGLRVSWGSVAKLGRLIVRDFGSRCVYAVSSSTISPADSAESRPGWLSASGCGYGIAASGASTIEASYASVESNKWGLYASQASRVYAPNSMEDGDTYAWGATGLSVVWVEDASATAETTFYTFLNGVVYADGADVVDPADPGVYLSSSMSSFDQWYIGDLE